MPVAIAIAMRLSSLRAAETPLVTHIIEQVPRTPEEVDLAHAKSQFPCTQLPAGAALVQKGFGERVYYDVKLQANGAAATKSLLFDWGRWPVVSFGTRMTEEDRAELPLLTSGAILERVDNSYISIQVRVHRAAPDGAPYLHYVPMAGVGAYGKPEKTEEFTALQQAAVNGVRGLGLFLKPGQARTPRTLRTLVVAIKGQQVVVDDRSNEITLKPSLELMFVRMRMVEVTPGAAAAEAVQLHAFGTRRGVTELVYFAPCKAPEKLDECSLRSTIRITEYTFAGQYPSARATRRLQFRAREEFSIASLNEHAKQTRGAAHAFDYLTETLDAIIDGKVKHQ